MPALPVFKFHTKLIQSILDPVAQQVSQLVIVHEEAAEGGIAHDLTGPVRAVDAAVQNLVTVGKSTLETTKDEHLKKDMPPTFEMVDTSSKLLVEASIGIDEDKFSKPHKKMLLDGSRGILQGVSSLLLVFDQAEVRKMVKACNGIIEYLQVAEVVQTLEELVQFTKNLSGGMTSMYKQVEPRTEDLTNASHANILREETDQIKRALPLLLSSMKAYATLKKDKRKGAPEAQENRNYIVIAMSDSLKEIVRVLQLTSPSEEEGAMANASGSTLPGGILPGTLAAKVFEAKTLLAKTGKDAAVNREGILAMKAVLKDARRLAKGLSSEKKAFIDELCSEIESLAKELEELQARGEGDSVRAQAIARAISEKMDRLERELNLALTRKVAEDFKDPMGPLNALSTAAMAPLDAANREETYSARSEAFQVHSKKMADTAAALAKSGIVTDRQLANDLLSTSKKVKAIAPQIVFASKIVFENPDNEAAKEHFSKLKEDYQKHVEKLTGLVDGGVDAVDFIRVSEEQLKEDLNAAKVLTRAGTDSKAAFGHVASAARTANRVVAVTKGEAENSTDVNFKDNLETSSTAVTHAIGPMVTGAKGALKATGNVAVQEQFDVKADQLVSAVHDIFDVVDKQYNPPPPPPRPPTPTPEQPELPPAVPPRPPSPVEQEPVKSEDPIGFAAHQLDKDAKQWENNAMVESARKMAKLMMQMAKFTRGEGGEVGSKKELIQTARMIVKESEEVVKMARKVAEACTDKRMKRAVLQMVDKIPTIATQLKIITAVKATRQGGDDPEADQEASEMLTNNAENLMSAVSEVLYSTEAATIRVPADEREKLGLQWVKRS